MISLMFFAFFYCYQLAIIGNVLFLFLTIFLIILSRKIQKQVKLIAQLDETPKVTFFRKNVI